MGSRGRKCTKKKTTTTNSKQTKQRKENNKQTKTHTQREKGDIENIAETVREKRLLLTFTEQGFDNRLPSGNR